MRALAFCVHILTAAGAALALLALVAAVRNDWVLMFVWLGAALIVDGIDGPLARAVNVKKELPRWSGDVLDLVVDYATYVFVPAYAVAAGGLMPDKLSIPCGIAIAIAGALYFADRDMKTADNHFRGFPAVWNLIAFYLLLLRPTSWIAAATVVLFAVLTFVPINFVHPLRVARFRATTVALLVLWAALAAAALWQGLAPDFWIVAALCLIGAYFLGIGLVPTRRPPT
jgi:phosphatidylcholine synthase